MEKPKILIVDDSKPMLKLLEVILKDRFSVYPMQYTLEAINWLQKGNIPDIIITDIQIPDIDGIEFINHASNSVYYSNIPILILSGYSEEEVFTKNKHLKIAGYVRKPFDPVELLSRITAILSKEKVMKYSN